MRKISGEKNMRKKLEYLNHFVNENDFVVVLSDYILAFTAYSVEFDWKSKKRTRQGAFFALIDDTIIYFQAILKGTPFVFEGFWRVEHLLRRSVFLDKPVCNVHYFVRHVFLRIPFHA